MQRRLTTVVLMLYEFALVVKNRKSIRIATKAKSDAKLVSEGGVVNVSSKKQTKEKVARYVAELLSDLDTQKVYNSCSTTSEAEDQEV